VGWVWISIAQEIAGSPAVVMQGSGCGVVVAIVSCIEMGVASIVGVVHWGVVSPFAVGCEGSGVEASERGCWERLSRTASCGWPLLWVLCG